MKLDPGQRPRLGAAGRDCRTSFGDQDEVPRTRAKKAGGAATQNLARTQTRAGVRPPDRGRDSGRRKAAFEQAIELDDCGPAAAARARASRRSATASWPRAARRSRSAVSARPRRFAACAAIWARPTSKQKRDKLVDARSTTSPRRTTPRTRRRIFYDAIAKQTTNRPVEALAGRAEGDRAERQPGRLPLAAAARLGPAARSASLGRIYTDLGFQDAASVEGWNSVNTDPSQLLGAPAAGGQLRRAATPRDRAGERALPVADAAAAQHHADPARVSAESNLFLIERAGPIGTLAFNEFNPLFNRNQVKRAGRAGMAAERRAHSRERGHRLGHIQQGSPLASATAATTPTAVRENNVAKRTRSLTAYRPVRAQPRRRACRLKYRHRDLETGRHSGCISRTDDIRRRTPE